MLKKPRRISVLWCALLAAGIASAAEQRGEVRFGGLPVPGATITATLAEKRAVAISDAEGNYVFSDLADGSWSFQVEMLCFETARQEVTVGSGSSTPWELNLLPLSTIQAAAGPAMAITSKADAFQKTSVNATTNPQPGPAKPAAAAPAPEAFPGDLAARAADGFLINGSSNNGASSPFALSQAFGNARKGRSLYNGGLGFIFDSSAIDARPYSLTGQDTPKPDFNHFQGVASFGGPVKIPHVLRNGPLIFVGYQWVHNRTATTQSGLVPTLAERDAVTNTQAQNLLRYYPQPNFTGSSVYNYQTSLLGVTDQDNLQSRASKTLGRMNQISGSFAYQWSSVDSSNLFGFTDNTKTQGITTGVNWVHRINRQLYATLGYQFSRLSLTTTPYFANQTNVSGQAGIAGNDQSPRNWGPPTLLFANGITSLTDAQASTTHNQTGAVSLDARWSRSSHNISFGGDFRRLQFNSLGQQNGRGTFAFTGLDFTGFEAGVPDTVSLAIGNPDKYLRANSWDAFINDDWRIGPGLTLNGGIRWEYSSPFTERYGRLSNLAVTQGFANVSPVTGSGLLHPDRSAFQPRVGFSWRPFAASSTVVRGGYGMYYNTSVYQQIATQLAQQPPFSKNISVPNSAVRPLTLANGFNVTPPAVSNTFGIDPDFRVGFAHNWQLSVQRDLPGSMVATLTYLGIKGTREVQQFLPNTYPQGGVNPCPACVSGFSYLASNGNSTRESGQVQLRRRLHNGITASADYTFAKSIDDAALGGKGQGIPVIAQDWLNLDGERARSTFDQRHLLVLQGQYTTGMGIGGGTLLSGWKGTLFKEWTVTNQMNVGSGLPLTPIYFVAVPGTGVTGSVRPDYTGAALYNAPSGLFLNPGAYAPPAAGHWGNAGRNSITGPAQFTFNASLSRTFRLTDRYSMDLRVDSVNAINNVTFPNWNTIIRSAQFGAPTIANPMRSLQTTLRVRF